MPPLDPSPPVTVERSADTTVLHLRGEVDINDDGALRAAGLTAVEAALPVALDCRELEFLDSSGLSLFARLLRARLSVTVVGARPQLRTMLSSTGLEPLLQFRD